MGVNSECTKAGQGDADGEGEDSELAVMQRELKHQRAMLESIHSAVFLILSKLPDSAAQDAAGSLNTAAAPPQHSHDGERFLLPQRIVQTADEKVGTGVAKTATLCFTMPMQE